MPFVRPRRVAKLAAILEPATLLRFHKALVDRKYRRLFSSAGSRRKPGPKGPLRNPRFGDQRIAGKSRMHSPCRLIRMSCVGSLRSTAMGRSGANTWITRSTGTLLIIKGSSWSSSATTTSFVFTARSTERRPLNVLACHHPRPPNCLVTRGNGMVEEYSKRLAPLDW